MELIVESGISTVKYLRQLDKDALRNPIGRDRELQVVQRCEVLVLWELRLDKSLEPFKRQRGNGIKIGVGMKLNPILLLNSLADSLSLTRSFYLRLYLFSV